MRNSIPDARQAAYSCVSGAIERGRSWLSPAQADGDGEFLRPRARRAPAKRADTACTRATSSVGDYAFPV